MYSRDHYNIVEQLSVNKKIKWIINKDLVYGTVEAWMGGEFEGEWIHVYVCLSSFPVHQKLSQHC